MESLKLRLLNQFGAPESMEHPTEVEVHFPYENSDALIKRMTNGHVRILNNDRGELEVDISDFELQGMKVGRDQNFRIKLYSPGKIKSGVFTRILHIESQTIDGVERKALVRK